MISIEVPLPDIPSVLLDFYEAIAAANDYLKLDAWWCDSRAAVPRWRLNIPLRTSLLAEIVRTAERFRITEASAARLLDSFAAEHSGEAPGLFWAIFREMLRAMTVHGGVE